ncbi:MAG: CHAP domain-containing protein [Eubacterium sp.]
MKKFVSLFLPLVIIFTMTVGINTVALATERTSDEAVKWAASKVGTSIDYDGYYGAQCVDFIMEYYDYLGGEISGGNAVDYATNDLPEGWTRTKGGAPQKGDILIYAGGTDQYYGHVAIYESELVSYHQGGGIVYKSNRPYYNITSSRGAPYWGCIHPNFADSNNADVSQDICEKGHTIVEDAEILPNCTMSGKTAGSHCSVCGVVIVAQQFIEAKGHDFGDNFKYCSRCLIENPNYVESQTEIETESQTIAVSAPYDAVNDISVSHQSESILPVKKEIKLKTPLITKIKKYKKAFSITWKKISNATGYQIQYSTDKQFKDKKTITVKNSKSISLTVKKLKSKTKYYVRVRAYNITYENSTKIKTYSSWSKIKTVTVK